MERAEDMSCEPVPPHRPWFRFWPEGVAKHVDYPEVSLYQFVVDSARRSPYSAALISGERRVTYRELDLASTRLACGLQELGVARDDRVMIVLRNSPEFVISYYGILKAGAIMTAASPLCKRDELERQVGDADPKVIICEVNTLPLIEEVVPKRAQRALVVIDGTEAEGIFNFEKLIAAAEPSVHRVSMQSQDDIAVLQYTGGTTGLPKGAMMTHFNLVANAIQNALWFKWTKDDVVLGVLSLCHTWGLCTCINSAVFVGAPVVLVPRFDPEEVLCTVEREKVTIAYGSASMFSMLLNASTINERTVSSLRLAKAGAMPIPDEVKRKWDGLGGCELTLGYGLTEASPETHDSPPERVKRGSIGIPIIDTDAKIVDLETGAKELGPDEIGELALRGPQVMKGYWNAPQETARVLRDGWLFTGDIAQMDEEGYFYVLDRRKDLIKYKGYSIFPAEVETILDEHPAVRECAVVGRWSSEVGEVPTAFVVLNPKISISRAELIDFCAQRIAPYKRIREVEFVSEIPKTVVGKPLRRALRGDGSCSTSVEP